MDAKREDYHQPLKILLVNVHSYWNAGDNALTQEALRQLAEQFPQASFTLAMNDPASHEGKGKAVGSFTAWVKPIVDKDSTGWRWQAFPGLLLHSVLALAGYRLRGHPWFAFTPPEVRELLDAYLEADMVVSTAGNFLYTSGWLGLPFLLALFSIFYGWLARKPLYTLPQTLGPITRRRELFLTRHVLSKMRFVLVRDPISAEVWQQWRVRGPQWELYPDLAFASAASQEQAEAGTLLAEYGVLGAPHEACLGVTLINWGAQDQTFTLQSAYEDAIEAAIRDYLQSHGRRVVLFAQVHGPTSAQDDLTPARRILARLEDLGSQVVLVDRWVPPYILKAAYGRMDLFLGSRLHSNIFALTERVPVVAIGYQYKTQGIMRMLGLESWVLDIRDVDQSTLVHLLRQAWVERDSTRVHIQEVLPQISKQAAAAGALIASDMGSLVRKRGGDG
jgi:colanic acid/amylovoran biosynthesis protein